MSSKSNKIDKPESVPAQVKKTVTVVRNIQRQSVQFRVGRKSYILEPQGMDGDVITFPMTFDTVLLQKQYAGFLVFEVKEV